MLIFALTDIHCARIIWSGHPEVLGDLTIQSNDLSSKTSPHVENAEMKLLAARPHGSLLLYSAIDLSFEQLLCPSFPFLLQSVVCLAVQSNKGSAWMRCVKVVQNLGVANSVVSGVSLQYVGDSLRVPAPCHAAPSKKKHGLNTAL